jgi:uncharacterized damage-inducible protein DinB
LEAVMAAAEAPNIVARQLQFVCRWILECVQDLSDEQLAWQPSSTAPSIRFHLFHIARCADFMHCAITESDRQVWHQESIAAQWGLDPAQLGLAEMGATLDGDAAMQLALPDKQRLLDYAERVLVATDESLSRIDDAEFRRVVPNYVRRPETVGYAVTDQLEHLSRHLGMIEAMRGFQGLDGTATI